MSRSAKILSKFLVAVTTVAVALPVLAISGPVPDAAQAEADATASDVATGFEAITPTRLVDTRESVGSSSLVGGVGHRIQITGHAGIPADAKAVSANFTITEPQGAGYLTVWDCATERPVIATVNFGQRETVPNSAMAPLDADGGICVFSTVDSHLVVDASGFYRSEASGRFTAITPVRLMDTRSGLGGSRRMPAGSTAELQAAGVAGLPSGMHAIALNVASVDPVRAGFVTVYPCDAPRPLAANLNPTPGHIKPNLVVASLSGSGSVCLYTSTEVDLVVDATGYLSSVSAATFTPSPPFRFTDTRERTRVDVNGGTGGAPLAAGQVLEVQVAGQRGIPSNAVALSANIAVTGATRPGFVTAFPCGARPNTANVNYGTTTAISNGAQLPLSADGRLCVYVYTSAHVVIDVNGWWNGPTSPLQTDKRKPTGTLPPPTLPPATTEPATTIAPTTTPATTAPATTTTVVPTTTTAPATITTVAATTTTATVAPATTTTAPAGPAALAPGTYNDTVAAYGAGWTVGSNPTLYQQNDHYTNIAGATATFSFTGTGFKLYAAKDFPHGIMAVSVDGAASVDVDLYSGTRVDAMVHERLGLPQATHTVVLKHTGRKNTNSTGTFVLLDRVDVVTGFVAPTPTTTSPATTTTTAPPVAAGDIAATRSQVGPRVPRTDRAGGQLPCGTYTAVRFTSKVIISEQGCTYTFTDVEVCFDGTLGTRTIVMKYSHVNCGWYFENGSHGGVTMEWTLVTSSCVGLRPQGATGGRAMEVRDSVIITGGPIDPESHCEPIASHPSPGGVTSNVHIARSRFIAEIRPTPCYTSYCAGYTGITNVTGTDYVFTDSVFGDPAQVHPAWYMIYEIGATFIRPRFYPGKAAVFYYGAPTGADLVSPTFL